MQSTNLEPTPSQQPHIEVPEGATLEPLLRGPSEAFGGSPGSFVYTTAESKTLEPTEYSLLKYGDKDDEGVGRTQLVDNRTGEKLATIELRPGTRGATLITPNGEESTHLTATAALGSILNKPAEY